LEHVPSRKKNLTIGIGLINSTSVGELKTILAHEFGHFSQRSMKWEAMSTRLKKLFSKPYTTTKTMKISSWSFQEMPFLNFLV
jgi:hypothetical protein